MRRNSLDKQALKSFHFGRENLEKQIASSSPGILACGRETSSCRTTPIEDVLNLSWNRLAET